MNKRGMTLLELLISITIVSIVVLLMVRVMFSLDSINNSKDYASGDSLTRTQIIKRIQNDFLDWGLKGINVEKEGEKTVINFMFDDREKKLEVYDDYLVYDNEVYKLQSKKASYDKCIDYQYTRIDDDYYMVSLNIRVKVNGDDKTKNDDITLTHLGFKGDDNSFMESYKCS